MIELLQLIQEKKMNDALVLAEKILQQNNDRTVLQEYLKIAIHLEEYERAIDFVEEYQLKSYFLDEERFLYVTICIAATELEQAESLLAKIQDKKNTLYMDLKIELEEKQAIRRIQIKKKLVKLIHSDYLHEDQQAFAMTLMEKLTFSEKEYYVEQFVKRIELSPLFRSLLIDEWYCHSLQSQLSFVWFGQEKEITKQEMFSITQSTFLQQGKEEIRRISHSEELIPFYLDWFQRDAIALYPYTKKYFTNGKEWLSKITAVEYNSTESLETEIRKIWGI